MVQDWESSDENSFKGTCFGVSPALQLFVTRLDSKDFMHPDIAFRYHCTLALLPDIQTKGLGLGLATVSMSK